MLEAGERGAADLGELCGASPAATRALPEVRRSLEELSERRQSMVQRVKAAQKERDALSGDKAAAEEYLAKERECLGAQSVLAQVLTAKAKVGAGGVQRGWQPTCTIRTLSRWGNLRAATNLGPMAAHGRRTWRCPTCCLAFCVMLLLSKDLSCILSALQATVEQIESSVAKLQEKLAKEREKHAKYDVVLKEHEQRWVVSREDGGQALGCRGATRFFLPAEMQEAAA